MDEDVAAAMKTAFEATDRPARYASATYDQTRRLLDDYAAAWVRMRTSACQETRVRGTQSERLLDLRMQCLDRRLDKLRALTTLLTAPRGAPLDDAIEAAVRLPDVTGCADRDALLASVPPPADEPTREAVAAIRRRLDEAEALLNSGEYGGGLDGVATAADDARAIAYSPVLAEALFLRGQLEDASGDLAAAQATLSETILIGADAHTDRLVAEAWIALLGIVGYDQALVDEGLAMKLAVEAALGRADAGPQLEGDMLNTLALIEWRKGDFATAQNDHERALEIRRASDPPDRVRVADSLNNLAMLFSSQGKYEAAQAYHERALAERTAVFGETHPLVADSLDNLGVELYHQGKYDEALPYYQLALEIRVLALGPEHRNVGTSHNNIGSLFLDRGDYALAASEYEHALAIWEPVFGADHPDIALVLSNLGDLANRRGDYARALEVCRRALVIEAPSLGQDHPDLAYNLTCSGEALLGLGRAGEALEPIARALRLREQHEVDLAERGRTRFAMARALRDTGGDRARARQLASAARDDYADAGAHTAKQRAAVEQWLARPSAD